MSGNVALVTGGTGFVGSNLCRKLMQGDWQVHVIAIPNDSFSLIDDIREQLSIHIHDGTTESMNSIVAAVRPDVVFHLAALFLSEHVSADIDRLIISNILLGTQLLEAMAVHNITKIVNTGTSWQHYKNKPYSAVNLYAATKQAFEDILQFYVDVCGVSAITLKLFDTYGPNDPRPKLFNMLDKVARENSPLEMSPGEQLIDIVHIDDVVHAFVLAAEQLKSGVAQGHECYAVSSGSRISLKELVTLYERVIGKALSIIWGGRKYREREVMLPWENGKKLPGWSVRIGLEEGMLLMEKKGR